MNSYNNKNHNNNINKANSSYSGFDLIVINLVIVVITNTMAKTHFV